MADIQQFIQMATSNLKIDEGTAKNATGGLLGFLGDKVGQGDFQALLGQLPGAADFVSSAAPAGGAPTGSGGGMLGGLSKLAGGAGGALGGLGSAAGVLGALQASGLKTDQIGGFVTQFMSFAKQNVSGDLLGKILSQVPDLQKLAK